MVNDFTARPRGSFGQLGPGSRVAGYLVETQIGAGGMAIVFRARDELLGRLAAVKVIAPSMANDEEFRARFLRESRAAAAVDSLYIVPVYGAGEADGLLYIATRYVAAGDLSALLARAGGRLEARRAVALLTQVASALDAAHSAGLVHRDVKPQNILVDSTPERPEHAYLSDFGLSKGTQSSTRLTAHGAFLGTPDYSAPEQIKGGYVDGRADQYALACVAFVLLTGSRPFERGDTMATMFAHLQSPVPLVTRYRPELPPALDAVIGRALAKSPADRYARCGDFAAALQEALDRTRPAAARDPWAWLAMDKTAEPAPAGPRAAQPVADSARPPSTAPAPQFAPWPQSPPPAQPQPQLRPPAQPQPPQARREAGWLQPGAPPAFTANGPAARPDTGYESTVFGAGLNAGPGPGPGSWADGKRRSNRRLRLALVGGAALILAAAGAFYAVKLPGAQHSRLAVSASSQRPTKTSLATTITVPGDNTVDTTWLSPDGTLLAASGQGRTVYVWDTANGKLVRTINAPTMTDGKSLYDPVIDNVAFSADDASVSAVVYPNVPTGTPLPGGQSTYTVYRWNLATGGRSTAWSISTPYTVAFSNDMSTALTSDDNHESLVKLSPALSTAPPVTVPGTVDQSYAPPYELDRPGDRMIYHPTNDETYVWDFPQEKVIAKLRSSAYTVLSTDGKAILATYPTGASGTSGSGTPSLWEVATQSSITPADPRWKQQLRLPWQFYSWNAFSTDGTVVATMRAGGKIDLWSTATGKYLLTITDPNYRKDELQTVGRAGSEAVILASEKTVNAEHEYRQVDVWETPLG
jgi:serine/threonine-protein kinase